MSLETLTSLDKKITGHEPEIAIKIGDKPYQIFEDKLHDLKSPLAAAMAFSELLQRSLKPSIEDVNLPPSSELAERLSYSLNQLSARINYTLEEIRLSEEIKPGCITVDDLLQEVVRNPENIDVIRSNGIQLYLSPSCEGLKINAEPNSLLRVLNNLIVNAAHAMEGCPFKQLDIFCATEKDCALIFVKDSGPGVPPEIQDKIFDKWFTTKRGTPQNGTGLGLYQSRRIVETFKGKLDLAPPEPGKGATFFITLPLNPC